jgi:hypothetical protein
MGKEHERILGRALEQLKEMGDLYSHLKGLMTPSATEKVLMKKMESWTVRLGGAMGELTEFSIAVKHYKKQRVIVDSKNTGDVVIGLPDDDFAKTVQSKSISSSSSSTVQGHINSAVKQMAGMGGEVARPKDNYSIRITINNIANTWPLSDSQTYIPDYTDVEDGVQNAFQSGVGLQKLTSQSNRQSFLNQVFQNNRTQQYLTDPGVSSKTTRKIEVTKTQFPSNLGLNLELDLYNFPQQFVMKAVWPFGKECLYGPNDQPRVIKQIIFKVDSKLAVTHFRTDFL